MSATHLPPVVAATPGTDSAAQKLTVRMIQAVLDGLDPDDLERLEAVPLTKALLIAARVALEVGS